ncbi:hypothetical protein [Dongia sp.]|uniref:hypothetical protein n=1 Tax=Dongia sp. TaxID=1977262 RepID=UPI003753D11C
MTETPAVIVRPSPVVKVTTMSLLQRLTGMPLTDSHRLPSSEVASAPVERAMSESSRSMFWLRAM